MKSGIRTYFETMVAKHLILKGWTNILREITVKTMGTNNKSGPAHK